VHKPVIPGIMPVTSIASVKRMAEMQGSEFPAWLLAKLEAVGDDAAAVRAVGIAEATNLCAALLEGGAPGLHFYTMNRSGATLEIYRQLGLVAGG
jgi:methylenetetrahydrofolate reductase (NADPH)